MTSYTPKMLQTIIFFGRGDRGPGPLYFNSVKIIVCSIEGVQEVIFALLCWVTRISASHWSLLAEHPSEIKVWEPLVKFQLRCRHQRRRTGVCPLKRRGALGPHAPLGTLSRFPKPSFAAPSCVRQPAPISDMA